MTKTYERYETDLRLYKRNYKISRLLKCFIGIHEGSKINNFWRKMGLGKKWKWGGGGRFIFRRQNLRKILKVIKNLKVFDTNFKIRWKHSRNWGISIRKPAVNFLKADTGFLPVGKLLFWSEKGVKINKGKYRMQTFIVMTGKHLPNILRGRSKSRKSRDEKY